MLGALIIVFREVIEAGLIVGIVMAATRGVAGRGRWINIGIGGGVLGAAIVAAFAGVISQAFEGAGQELFNASILGIAVVMLMWHNAWMARHGREIADEMRNVGTAVSEGAKPLTALAIVVGLAVLREGSEVVLFLYGILASGTSGSALLVGGVLGIAAGAAFTAVGRQPVRPHAACADRLHRAADRNAADGLWRDAARDVPADAAGADLAARTDRRR
jgi:high-affinity iron transporter